MLQAAAYPQPDARASWNVHAILIHRRIFTETLVRNTAGYRPQQVVPFRFCRPMRRTP